MKVTGKKLHNILKNFWPQAQIFTSDAYYWLPTKEYLVELVRESNIDKYKYIKEVHDCDDFALMLHAYAIDRRYKKIMKNELKPNEWFSLSLGQIWGSKFRGKDLYHAINVAVTQSQEIILIEPQSDEVWKPKKGQDVAFWVRL